MRAWRGYVDVGTTSGVALSKLNHKELAMKTRLILAIAFFIAMFTASIRAQVNIYEVQPTTYTSPNGQYSLYVNPGERHGGGPGKYVMKRRDGSVIWSGEREFTLTNALVTDGGCTAGYGYNKGPQGFGKAQGEDKAYTIYMNEMGDVKISHTIPRDGMSSCMGGPSVGIFDLSLELENGSMTAIARFEQDKYTLLTFQLSTGTLSHETPLVEKLNDEYEVFVIFTARAVRGTPLTLISWSGRAANDYRNGCFTLLDAQGTRIWQHAIVNDYRDEDDAKEDRIWESLRESGAILRSANPQEFTIRAVKESKAITFGIEKAADNSWTVKELRRADLPAPSTESAPASRPKRKQPVIAEHTAHRVGTIDLQNNGTRQGEIRDCHNLMVTNDGDLAFQRLDRGAKTQPFVVVNPSSKAVRSFTPAVAPYMGGEYVPLSKDKWLLTGADTANDKDTAKLAIYWLDTNTGKCEKATDTDIDYPKGIVSLGGSAFAILGSVYNKYTSSEGLTAFDGAKQLWSIRERYEDPAALFSPESMCVTTTGEIAVLENVANDVKYYDKTGKHLRTVDLEKAWGRKPNYPSDIFPDVDGGVIIYDFDGVPPIVRMKADGTVLADLTPKFANGKVIKSRVVVRSDGQLWTTDGNTLCRLDESGVVVEVIGDAPKSEDLSEVATMTLDANQNIYVLDSKTGAVHQYDERGARIRVYKPNPTDFTEQLSSYNQLAVAPSGDVYVERSGIADAKAGEYIHFSAIGERRGPKSFDFGEIHSNVYFQPNSTKHWRVGYQKIALVENDRDTVVTIERGVNDYWLSGLDKAAQAPDGSIAVMSHSGPFLMGETMIHVFDREGNATRSFTLPDNVMTYAGFSYDGTKFAFITSLGDQQSGVVILRADGVPEFTFPLPLNVEGYLGLFLNRDRNKVWVYSNKLQIDRYSLNRKR